MGGGWYPDDVRVAEGGFGVEVEEVDVVVVEVDVLMLGAGCGQLGQAGQVCLARRPVALLQAGATALARHKLVVRVPGVVSRGAAAGVAAAAAAVGVVFVVTQVRVEGAA